MGIDPFQAGQFSEDGSVVLSQISLDFSCRQCQNDISGPGTVKSNEVLVEAAAGYHD